MRELSLPTPPNERRENTTVSFAPLQRLPDASVAGITEHRGFAVMPPWSLGFPSSPPDFRIVKMNTPKCVLNKTLMETLLPLLLPLGRPPINKRAKTQE
jgi:hypothetical protein